jgi:hypothetical protein
VYSENDGLKLRAWKDAKKGQAPPTVQASEPVKARPVNRGGRPDQNTIIVNRARELKGEGLGGKAIITKLKIEFPGHPIFEGKDPAGKLRTAICRAKKSKKIVT